MYTDYVSDKEIIGLKNHLYSFEPRSLKPNPEQRRLNHPKHFTNSTRCSLLEIPLLI